MSTVSVGARGLDIGRVFARTFNLVGRYGAPFYVLALMLNAAPTVLTQWVRLAGSGASRGGGEFFLLQLVNLVLACVSLGAGAWLQAALFTGTVGALDGRQVEGRELLRTTTAVILPLVGVTILNVLGLALGFVLLIVPGLILVTMWAAVAPVAALERPGVFAAFGVSARLTKGRRWTILGLLVLAGLAFGIIGAIAQFVIASLFYGGASVGSTSPLGFMFFAALTAHGPLAFVGVLLSALITAALVMVLTVGVGVLYYDLRTLRDGESPEDLAQVFA